MSPIKIAIHPQSKSVGKEMNTTLSALASGTNPTYQWWKDGLMLAEGGSEHFDGIKEHVLSICNATPDVAGEYWCEASNEVGGDSSEHVTLTVSSGTSS